MTFSERNGHVSPSGELQIASMDGALRTALWNVVLSRLFGKLGANMYGEITQEYHVFINLWRNFFKQPMDQFDKHLASRREWFKDVFDTMEWYVVYDFFEFCAQKMIPFDAQDFARETNAALESERAGYRLAGNHVVPATSVAAAETLLEALETAEVHGAKDVDRHLKAGLAAWSRRPDPDLKAVLKAVPLSIGAACRHILSTGRGQATPDLASGSDDAHLSAVLDDPRLGLSAARKRALLELHGAAVWAELADASERDAAGSAVVTYSFLEGAAFCAFLLGSAAEAGLVPPVAKRIHRPATPDPWGERKL